VRQSERLATLDADDEDNKRSGTCIRIDVLGEEPCTGYVLNKKKPPIKGVFC